MGNLKRNYCLKVWGDMALFTRPELKVERFSYPVITPSAARGIFTAIFWKPAILWHITEIEVLKPVRYTSVRRNEVGAMASPRAREIFIEEARQQRASQCLADVAYRIYADLEYLPPEQRKVDHPAPSEGPETPQKYFCMFERRAEKGQTFHQPYLGCREFPAYFRLLSGAALAEDAAAEPNWCEDADYGIVLYDMDHDDPEGPSPMFYHAEMKQGRIEVPAADSPEVLR